MKNNSVVEEIIKIGKLLYTKNYIYATNGNISIRKGKNTFITATGLCKGELRPKDVLQVTLDGKVTKGEPSIELPMHLGIYNNRKDINAIILAHPFFTNLIGIQPGALNLGALSDIGDHLKKIEFIRNIPPGSKELANTVVKAIKNVDIVVIHRFGTVTAGATLHSARYKLERLEYLARFLVYKQIIF